jgi:REP element-mobilizing transposase RayT
MPRPLRPIDDGLIYHVINRGNNRQHVFHKPADFQAFLAALADLKDRKPFELYGYCLLNNHFHLLLRPKGPTISRILQSLLVSHTRAISSPLPLGRARVAGAIQESRDPERRAPAHRAAVHRG